MPLSSVYLFANWLHSRHLLWKNPVDLALHSIFFTSGVLASWHHDSTQEICVSFCGNFTLLLWTRATSSFCGLPAPGVCAPYYFTGYQLQFQIFVQVYLPFASWWSYSADPTLSKTQISFSTQAFYMKLEPRPALYCCWPHAFGWCILFSSHQASTGCEGLVAPKIWILAQVSLHPGIMIQPKKSVSPSVATSPFWCGLKHEILNSTDQEKRMVPSFCGLEQLPPSVDSSIFLLKIWT